MVRRPAGPRRTLPWPEAAALAAVAAVALLSWLLVSGTATGVYRSYADQGDPPLLPIRVPGPEPAGEAAPAPGRTVSQLGHYGYFWSERAFHYRTALMFAVDDAPDPGLLHHDTFQQHPDGVDAWREYTLLMEPVYGFLYRLAGDQSRPFVEFLLALVPLVHVLLLFPVYAVARLLGARRPAAVGAAVMAAGCALGFSRLAGSLLLKEDFSLLLLLVFTALHLAAWRRGGRVATAAAAAALAAVLASWHLAQFLAAMLLGATAVARLAAPASARGEDADAAASPPSWLMPAAYLAAFLLAGLTPSLRERWFVLSPPTAVPAAWLAAALLAPRLGAVGRRAAGRVLLLLVLTAGALAAAFLNPVHGGDYGHVSGLLAAKLRHRFVVPADPHLLSFSVRQFWTSPFHTPHLDEIVRGLGFFAPLGALATGWSLATALRPGTPAPRRGFLLAVPALAAGWLLAARLGVVLLPFLAVATALMLQDLAALARRTAPRAGWIAAGVLVLAAAANVPTNLARPLAIARDVMAGRPAPVATDDAVRTTMRTELFRWLTANTPGPGSRRPGGPGAVLTDVALSPQLLLYTGRPTVLNSQFENVEIRRRAERYLQALYAEDPAVLHDLARTWDARYLVLDRTLALGDGVGTSRWMAGAPAPLTTATTAVRLHVDPLGVPGFAPLWDNEYYRVFAVLPPGRAADPAAWEARFGAWWQPENLTIEGGRLTDLVGDRDRLQEFEAAVQRLQDEQGAILAAVARRRPGWPDLLTMQRQLALARLDACEGRDRSAEEEAATARLANAVQAVLAEVDPATGVPLRAALGRLLDGGAGQPGWTGLLARTRAEPRHHAVAAQLAAMAGRYAEAAAGFRHAAARWGPPGPGPAPALRRQLWDETVLWLAAAGRCGDARELAGRWAPHAGNGDGPGALVLRCAP